MLVSPLMSWVLRQATRECQKSRASVLGTPHILLALLKERSVGQCVRMLEIDVVALQSELRRLRSEPAPAAPFYSAAVAGLLATSALQAQTCAADVLFSLARLSDSQADRALRACGQSLERMAEVCPRWKFQDPSNSMIAVMTGLSVCGLLIAAKVGPLPLLHGLLLTSVVLPWSAAMGAAVCEPTGVRVRRCRVCGYQSPVPFAFGRLAEWRLGDHGAARSALELAERLEPACPMLPRTREVLSNPVVVLPA